jgi:hypothetical protein
MKPDLYIAAMGRSGSTLVTNWLTNPGRQILFYEPNFFAGKITTKLASQCSDFDINVADTAEIDVGAGVDQWLDNLFGRQFEDLKWGFKEVLCDLHERCLRELEPRFTIVTVRNIADIYLSFIEKHKIQKNEDRFPPQWSFDYCVSESQRMVAFVDRLQKENHRHIVVRYEDFVSLDETRIEIEKLSGWCGGGDLSRHLSLFDRSFEAQHHKGGITKTIRKKETRELDPVFFERAGHLADTCQAYQSYFGFL